MGIRHRTFAFFALLIAALVLTTVPADARDQQGLRGIVIDQQGHAIPNALVTASGLGRQVRTRTDATGKFSFSQLPFRQARLIAVAGPLSSRESVVEVGQTRSVELVVSPSGSYETVTVTATRFPVPSEMTPDVRTLTTAAVQDSGAISLDGILRQFPSFTLFRRTPGWAANPTSQGVSLRGLGASGASRALVLADGIPMNDPFGGWVYWNRIPRADISRIEAAVGPESDVYGTDALGGAIQVLRRPAQDQFVVVDTSFANLATPSGSAAGGLRFGPWAVQASAQGFRTNGYVPIPSKSRGAVDSVVSSSFTGGEAEVDRVIGENGRAFVRGNYYVESRNNGTILQKNNANIREFSAGTDWATAEKGTFALRAFGSTESLGQSFSAIRSDRNSETLTRLQTVPVQQIGASAQWSGRIHKQTIFLGLDTRRIEGESDELAFSLGKPSAALRNGGVQRLFGVSGQAFLRPASRFLISLGARVDHWGNLDGFSRTNPFSTTPPSGTDYADRSETAFSPKLGVQYRATDRVLFFASASRAFRAPTLNELYRGFRVGNIVTLANPELRAERLTGVESGVRISLPGNSNVQGSWFWNRVDRPVANLTLNIAPDLITRQRQNLGQLRSRGIEADWDWVVSPEISFATSYTYTRATVTDFPAAPELVGLWIPQVPRNTAAAQIRYSKAKLGTGTLQARYQGKQYDDDRNQLPLGGYFTLDAFVAHPMGRGVELYLAAENLLDRRYAVGRTPVFTMGPPEMARIGLRWTFGDATTQ